MPKKLFLLLNSFLLLCLWGGEANAFLGIGPLGGIKVDSGNGLVAYYNMQNEGGTVYDYSVNSNDSTSITGTTSTGGKIGAAMDFDGTDDKVVVADNSSLDFGTGQDFSVSAWIKTPTSWWGGALYRGIVSKDSGLSWSSTGDALGYGIAVGSDGRVSVALDGITSSSNFLTGIILSLDTWYHIVLTYDSNGTAYLYVDNNVEQSTASYQNGDNSNAYDVTIGTVGDTGRVFDGLIDEVRIYNTALTAEEVADLYRESAASISSSLDKGLTGHWPLDEESETLGSDVINNGTFATDSDWIKGSGWTISGGTANFDASQINVNITQNSIFTIGKRYRLYFEISNVGGGVLALRAREGNNTITQISAAGNYTADFTALGNSFNFVALSTNTSTFSLDNVKIYELQAVDSTPNSNNGTLYQDATIFTTDQHGQSNGAMEFNGTTTPNEDKVDTGSDMLGTGADTISVWIYPVGWGVSNLGNIVANRLSGDEGTILRVNSNSGGLLQISSDPSAAVASSNASSIVLDQWQHIVATRTSGGIANLYIDSVLSGGAGQASGTPEAGTANLFIGNNATGDRTFNGKIADVRIYDRVLTATEIATLYNAYKPKATVSSISKGLIGHWPLTDKWMKSSTVVTDRTPSSNDGTATSVTVGGRSSLFNGTTSTIPTTITSNTGFTSGFTLSAWVNPENSGESNSAIIDKSNGISGSEGFTFANGINSTLNRLIFKIDTNAQVISDSSSITFGVWQQVLITVTSAGTANFYVNGQLSGTPDQAAGALSGITTSNALTIGNRSIATDRTVNGKIADVRIYDRVLSATEVTKLYDLGRPKASPKVGNFDGSTQYLSLTDNSDFEFGANDFALEAWINTDVLNTAEQSIISKWDNDSNNRSFVLVTNTYLSGDIAFSRSSTGSDYLVKYTATNTITANKWHHVLLVYDNSAETATLYLDGSTVAMPNTNSSGTTTANIFDSTAPIQIGGIYKWGGVQKYFDGEIDAVRVYNFGSNGLPSSIADLASYNSGSMGRIHPELQSYLTEAYELNGDPFAVKDSDHDMTNNGTTTFVKPQ